MALLEFRSPAAGGFFMMPETFAAVCKVLGREYSEQGCWLPEDLDGVIGSLEAETAREAKLLAQQQERARARGEGQWSACRTYAEQDAADEARRKEQERVSFGMRVFPLLDMLRRARRKGVKVMWGVP